MQILHFIFDKYDVNFCYLFGLYAKSKATPTSDVDLLISGKVKGLKYYGFNENEVYNIKIEKHEDNWYYLVFEADAKIIEAENGTIILDYTNKLINVNGKILKIQEGTDYIIKVLKTKIKTTSMQDFTNFLTEYKLFNANRLCKAFS